MIHEVRNKAGKTPESHYVVAVCDLCETRCEASVLIGRKGIKASEASEGLALKHGWVNRTTPTRRGPRSRKMTWDVQLVCRACQAAVPQEAAVDA